MRIRMHGLGVIAALAVFSFGSVAAAQDWESGDTGAWQQPPPEQPQQQPPPQQPPPQQQWGQPQPPPQGWQQPAQQGWQQPPQQQEPPPGWGQTGAAEDDENEPSDHSTVVGHFGVGFFGVADLPVGTLFDTMGEPAVRVPAPTVGVRYWLSDSLGLDATIGIGYLSNRAEMGDTILEDLSAIGFALHAGLPVVFMHEQHYKFLFTPEATFGITSGSTAPMTPGGNDILLSGLLFELGARIGAEIHFGFIDVPQLALQGSIGAQLRFESTVLDVDPNAPTVDSSQLTFGTSVQGDPWDIFVGSITAIYYLR